MSDSKKVEPEMAISQSPAAAVEIKTIKETANTSQIDVEAQVGAPQQDVEDATGGPNNTDGEAVDPLGLFKLFHIQKTKPWRAIEMLYRHNVLYSRAQLFKHHAKSDLSHSAAHPTDAEAMRRMREVLDDYTKSVNDYQAFRADGSIFFDENEDLVEVGQKMAALENLEVEAMSFEEGSHEAI